MAGSKGDVEGRVFYGESRGKNIFVAPMTFDFREV
jgi:hypothetical protein